MLGTIILCFAFCFATFAAFSVPPLGRSNWLGLAIMFLILAILLGPVVPLGRLFGP